MIDYGNLSLAASLVILFLLSAYCALYTGMFGLITAFLMRRRHFSLIVLIPAVWVALEYLRGHLLTGFPWNPLGYSQYKTLWLIQIADWGSYYAVSFLIIFVNTSVYFVFKENPGIKNIFGISIINGLGIRTIPA
jgi:apolipoprotein N-acyltransferase